MAVFFALYDEFADEELDTALWQSVGDPAYLEDGKLVIPGGGTLFDPDHAVRSQSLYDIYTTSGSQLPQVAVGIQSDGDFAIRLDPTDALLSTNASMVLMKTGGNLVAAQVTGVGSGGYSGATTITYNATNHRYLRFVANVNSTTVIGQHSPSGLDGSWTSFAALPSLPVTNRRLRISGTDDVYVDAVNRRFIPPPPPITETMPVVIADNAYALAPASVTSVAHRTLTLPSITATAAVAIPPAYIHDSNNVFTFFMEYPDVYEPGDAIPPDEVNSLITYNIPLPSVLADNSYMIWNREPLAPRGVFRLDCVTASPATVLPYGPPETFETIELPCISTELNYFKWGTEVPPQSGKIRLPVIDALGAYTSPHGPPNNITLQIPDATAYGWLIWDSEDPGMPDPNAARQRVIVLPRLRARPGNPLALPINNGNLTIKVDYAGRAEAAATALFPDIVVVEAYTGQPNFLEWDVDAQQVVANIVTKPIFDIEVRSQSETVQTDAPNTAGVEIIVQENRV